MRAEQWYEQAASNENRDAKLALEKLRRSPELAHALFVHGYQIGQQQEFEKSFLYIKRAADMNHPQAQMTLVSFYAQGRGTQKNNQLAQEYLIKSAENGFAAAQFALGNYFLQQRNEGEATQWIFKAGLGAREAGDANGLKQCIAILSQAYSQSGNRNMLEKKKELEVLLQKMR